MEKLFGCSIEISPNSILVANFVQFGDLKRLSVDLSWRVGHKIRENTIGHHFYVASIVRNASNCIEKYELPVATASSLIKI